VIRAATMTLLAAACTASGTPRARAAPAVQVSGAFTAAQAQRGGQTFARVCLDCHALGDFRGEDFAFTWRQRTAWDFYRVISETMPEDNPGNLSDAAYVDIVAYVLSMNGYRAGPAELPASRAALAGIPIGPAAERAP